MLVFINRQVNSLNRELSEVTKESPGPRKKSGATLDNSIARNRDVGAMGKVKGIVRLKAKPHVS